MVDAESPIGEQPAEDESTARWRRWIYPSFSGLGWKKTVQRIVARLVIYYLLIVIAVAFFQRSLIYLPTRVNKILPEDAKRSRGRVHDIQVTTDDGLTLHGWHVLPHDHSAKDRAECDQCLSEGRPLVLFFHGNGGNRIGRIHDCESFARLDADTFIFDYRGYGENPGSPTEDTIAADAQRMWDYVTSERKVKPNRIIIYGESIGGAVAIRLARDVCDAGETPKGLILAATFSSMTDAAEYHHPWLPVRLILLDRYPSTERIRSVTCPILQLHGRRDTFVPFEMGQKLFEAAPAMSANGVEKKFVGLSNAGHNDFSEMAFWNAVNTFVAEIAAAAAKPQPKSPFAPRK